MPLLDIIVASLLITGTTLIAIAAIGLLRLPDFFCRAHALTKAMTLGIMCMLIASWVYFGTSNMGFKILLAIIFQFITIPVSGHILGFVAFRKNIKRYKHKDIA